MKQTFTLIALIVTSCIYGQNNTCFGEKREMKPGTTTPYTKVKVGNHEGYFLLDFGTTGSTIDTNNFIGWKPRQSTETIHKFENFDFFGPWGTVTLQIQDHSGITGLKDFKQAGILGTDFLALHVFTLDYSGYTLYRATQNDFCTDSILIKQGFKAASTAGYFSNSLNKLNNTCTPNIPAVPVRIGGIQAIAQIDPGYDDVRSRHAVNINQAFFKALTDANITLVRNPAFDITLSTCVTNMSEPVFAYTLPEGISFSIIGLDGNPIVISADANIFVKQTPAAAKICGGVGTWQIPAGQIGASFLQDSKKIVFDPYKSQVWFYTR